MAKKKKDIPHCCRTCKHWNESHLSRGSPPVKEGNCRWLENVMGDELPIDGLRYEMLPFFIDANNTTGATDGGYCRAWEKRPRITLEE